MPLGRWKQTPSGRKKFILRALKLTRAPMKQIAQKVGRTHSRISVINDRSGIRSSEETRQIAQEAAKKRTKPRPRVFSNPQKMELIQKNWGLIVQIARPYWANETIRQAHESFQAYLEAAQTELLDALDKYDPTVLGRHGRPIKVSTWIGDHTRYFCLHTIKRRKNETQNQTQLDDDHTSTNQHQQPKTAQISRATRWQMAQIPLPARRLLRKLGLNLNNVAIAGYPEIKELLTAKIVSEKTGLTEWEQRLLLQTLEGKTHAEIANMGGKTGRPVIHQAIANAENRILQKLTAKLRE